VGFASTFDAGVLLLYLSERRWAKLCYEFSPQRKPTAVTVVTRGTSDDSNSFETAGGPLWLRITRSGRVWAFHASVDGAYWQLLRYFTLGEASGARVGFLAQSPTPCSAVHEHLRQVGAVRLILGLVEDELYGADEAAGILGHEQRSLTPSDSRGDATPEIQCLRHGQGMHEAHRRAAVDAIDQQFGQSPNMLLGDGIQALNGVPVNHGLGRHDFSLRARTITTERNGWRDSAMQAILAYAALISALGR